MKHISGPYKAMLNFHGQAVVDGIYGMQVAHFGDNTRCSSEGSHSISKKEAMANALLFAAAPELLEAAKKALKFFDDEFEPYMTSECKARAVEMLDSAIKKAEGDE